MIAIISDFGLKDPYVGIMKGVIKKINKNADIIDITHLIPPQNIKFAYFILKYSYKHFPENTVFLTVVDPGVGSNRQAIAIEYNNYYFVGPDNGIFSFIPPNKATIINLTNKQFYYAQNTSNTFHGRDIFAPIAAYVDKGVNLSKLGDKIYKMVLLNDINYYIKNNTIYVPLIYIDHFGNLIFNISKKDVANLKKDFIIKFQNKIISEISLNYSTDKDIIALFNSYNLLEIAKPQGSAKDFFNIDTINNKYLTIEPKNN